VDDGRDARQVSRPAAEDSRFRRVGVHDVGPHGAKEGRQADQGAEVAPRLRRANQLRNEEGAEIGSRLRLVIEQPAAARHQGRLEAAAIQVRHRVERVLLGAAQLQERDDVADADPPLRGDEPAHR
jgi:hypothetical protein